MGTTAIYIPVGSVRCLTTFPTASYTFFAGVAKKRKFLADI
jgi:hypothetical protein